MRKIIFLALAAGGLLTSLNALAADPGERVSPAPLTSIKPVNVPAVPCRIVSGTITVRLDGLLVNPQQAAYLFSPAFPAGNGKLRRIDEGTYFLQANRVPADQPYLLTVTALYDDSVVGRDGYIETRGQTYTGTVQINVPFGEDDRDFGVQFIDLR